MTAEDVRSTAKGSKSFEHRVVTRSVLVEMEREILEAGFECTWTLTEKSGEHQARNLDAALRVVPLESIEDLTLSAAKHTSEVSGHKRRIASISVYSTGIWTILWNSSAPESHWAAQRLADRLGELLQKTKRSGRNQFLDQEPALPWWSLNRPPTTVGDQLLVAMVSGILGAAIGAAIGTAITLAFV